MTITKQEFIQIAMGGVVSDQLIAKVDAAHDVPHVPTQSRVKTVVEYEHDPHMNFWGSLNGKTNKMVIVPGLLYCKFNSADLRKSKKSENYVDTEAGDIPGKISEGFKQGHCGFDVFHVNKPRSWSGVDGNMYGETLRHPEHFAAFGASLLLDRNTSDEDVKLFEQHGLFEFIMGARQYAQCPAMRITNRVDIDTVVRRDGLPTSLIPSRMHRWDPPLIIIESYYFHFLLSVDRSDLPFGDFSGYAMLDGYYAQGAC